MTPTEARKRVEELAETAMRSAGLGHDISIRLGRLRGLAAALRLLLAENERMESALSVMSEQILSDEMDEDQREHADFEGGYDYLVQLARSALQGETP